MSDLPTEEAIRAAEALLAPLDETERPEAYRDAPRGARGRILEAGRLLSPDDPLQEDMLGDFGALWAWVCRRPAIWELVPPEPDHDFDLYVAEGRPDLQGGPPSGHCLEGESTDAWLAVGHGHDGHTYLMWDTSATGIRVLEVDNSVTDVVMRDYPTVEAVMLELVLPEIMRGVRYRRDGPPSRYAPLSPGDKLGIAGCTLALLAGFALLIWLVWP